MKKIMRKIEKNTNILSDGYRSLILSGLNILAMFYNTIFNTNYYMRLESVIKVLFLCYFLLLLFFYLLIILILNINIKINM